MDFLENIINLLNSGNFDAVTDEVDEFLEKNPQYKTIDYYHFANPIEEILFDVYIGEIENVKTLSLDEPLEEIYHIYAISKLAQGDSESCEKYLKIANQINPVSAQILMRLCEFYQERHEEHMLRQYSQDMMKYAYDRETLVSSYFKLADYYYHTNQEMELYDHLFNFYMQIRTGENMGDVGEDIPYLKSHGVQVGFNEEIIKILLYLIEVHKQQNMPNAVEYFKKILYEILEFNKELMKMERGE